MCKTQLEILRGHKKQIENWLKELPSDELSTALLCKKFQELTRISIEPQSMYKFLAKEKMSQLLSRSWKRDQKFFEALGMLSEVDAPGEQEITSTGNQLWVDKLLEASTALPEEKRDISTRDSAVENQEFFEALGMLSEVDVPEEQENISTQSQSMSQQTGIRRIAQNRKRAYTKEKPTNNKRLKYLDANTVPSTSQTITSTQSQPSAQHIGRHGMTSTSDLFKPIHWNNFQPHKWRIIQYIQQFVNSNRALTVDGIFKQLEDETRVKIPIELQEDFLCTIPQWIHSKQSGR